MTSPSWFRLWGLDFLFTSDKANRRKLRPMRPLLSVEQLEDRMVPSALPSNVPGIENNPTPNPAPQSIGALSVNFPQNNSGLGAATFPTVAQASALGILAATLEQGQLYDQFLGVSVNSQGQSNPFTQSPWNVMAFGFGSGTQPGQPWQSAANNVGLANHQVPFTVGPDLGMQARPWTRQIAFVREDNTEVGAEAEPTYPLNFLKAKASEDNRRPDESALDSAEDNAIDALPVPTTPLSENVLPVLNRNQTGQERTPFGDVTDTPETLGWSAGFSYARGGTEDESASGEIHLSDLPTLSRSLSLFSLSPMQFSALLTGLAVSVIQVKSTDEAAETMMEEFEEEPIS